jgi:peroxiredoxin
MKRLFFLLLLLSTFCPSSFAQLTTKAGDEAPKITTSEYLINGLSKSKLKGKFLVLTICKNWDRPCFYNLPHLDSLRNEFSNDQLEFLILFRGSPELARKDIEGVQFDVSLAYDLYGATQIRYGDGETGLVGWPLTFLIDDQNIVRWQGGGSDLTVETFQNFIDGKHPVIDLSSKYVPLEPDAYLFEPMSPKELFDYHESDSIGSFVLAWEVDNSLGPLPLDFMSSTWSHNMSMGFHAPKTLENIFQNFFPKKRSPGFKRPQRHHNQLVF